MGKRSDFPRRKNDAYQTPYEAVPALLPFLRPGTRFDEPCCGEGRLVQHLEKHGHQCVLSGDIEGLSQVDLFDLESCAGEMFITNPPWTRKILHPLIEHLSDIAPTWLLFDAAWAHTRQAAPYLRRCTDIVSVGRVSWMENGTSSLDDCAWYRFDRPIDGFTTLTRFWGRK